MYKLDFLPVKVNSQTEASVHTESMIYPYALLKEARNYLTEGSSVDCVMKNGYVTFNSSPDIRWSVPDIVKAYEYFNVAKENKFSFFPIYGTNGTIGLYTSGMFKQTRVLVDAYMMNAVLVTKQSLTKKLPQMIDQCYSTAKLLETFTYAKLLERGYKDFLDSWLVNMGTDECYVCLNPITALYEGNTTWYYEDRIMEMKKLLSGEVLKTSGFELQGSMVVYTYLDKTTPISIEWVKSICNTYDSLMKKGKNFIPINDRDSLMPICYVSKDLSHIVKAANGECITVRNRNLKNVLLGCLEQGSMDRSDFHMLWSSFQARTDA